PSDDYGPNFPGSDPVKIISKSIDFCCNKSKVRYSLSMTSLIEQYIEDHKYAWAESTLRSERYRLLGSIEALNGNASAGWMALSKLKPYARAQTWNRICHFIDWCIENGHRSGPNEFKQFRKKNARQFKRVYERKVPDI